ncbi:MAG: hypothetical protein QGF68_20155 [Nitrospinota bacterium]|jgi:hypothetical protein|nr:hypothetical protein [Nitrospinota bacterium]
MTIILGEGDIELLIHERGRELQNAVCSSERKPAIYDQGLQALSHRLLDVLQAWIEIPAGKKDARRFQVFISISQP